MGFSVILTKSMKGSPIFMEKETNIDLGLDMDTGISKKVKADITEEERSIAMEKGRNIDAKDRSDEAVSAIANFRVLSNNRYYIYRRN